MVNALEKRMKEALSKDEEIQRLKRELQSAETLLNEKTSQEKCVAEEAAKKIESLQGKLEEEEKGK